MSEKPSSLRSQAEQVYNLTDQLQVQLQVLESSRVRVDVQINPYSAAVSSGDLEGDVEAIAFIVMMQAAHSAQEDLKAIMEQVKAINASKEKLCGLFDKTQAARPLRHGTLNFESVFQVMATLYAKQLEAETDELLGSLDSLSEMGETESLRLQMAMDRLSKLMSTLSNLLKKASETSSQIVQNLK